MTYLLIPGTWAIAYGLAHIVAPCTDSFWPLPVILALGCSGPVAAVLLTG